MTKATFLTAQQAAAELGVKPATLYAYVSRGLVRSEQVSDRPRDRRYHAEDIQRLKERQALRRNPARTAEQALSWGVPVLESGLTLISGGRLYYRGQDAAALALDTSLEAVASLLWTGTPAAQPPSAPPFLPREGGSGGLGSHPTHATLSPLQAFQVALVQAEAADPSAYDLRPESVAQKGFSILQGFVEIAAGGAPSGAHIAQSLQMHWAPEIPQAARLINAALVLCADHELNVSAFTARCVASSGASIYAAVLAGLAALQGVKHGGASRRVEALFQEVGRPERAHKVLSERLQRGEAIPGFGHPLYPDGDPRARLLLELLQEIGEAQELDLADAIAQAAQDLIGELPTLDFALVYLRHALALPPDAALTLFALGRTVGWIAHAIEQYQADTLIRPRARYTGPQP